MRRRGRLALLLAGALLLGAGCSDSGTPVVAADAGARDGLHLQDVSDPPRDHPQTTVDLRVDSLQPDTKPKPPAAWGLMTPMSQARRLHTSTLLSDGRVLVVGGLWANTGYEGLTSAELYDSGKNAWTAAGSTSGPHWGHQAVLLQDGRVLIVGGCGDGPSNVCMMGVGAEVYDPKNPATPWKKTGPVVNNRRSLMAALLPDGRVLVAGGFDNMTDHTSLEIYDPKADAWSSPAVSLSTPRNLGTMVTLKSGKVLMAGGFNPKTDQDLDTLELYDPSNGTIKVLSAKLKEARSSAAGVLLSDGRVLFVGGSCLASSSCTVNNAEIYDPVLDQTAAVGTPGAGTVDHTATLLSDGRVLVAGGLLKPQTAILFDAKANTWTPTAALNVERTSHAATLLLDGRVLVTGGEADNDATAFETAEIYTP